MAKWCHDDFLDASLNLIRNNANQMLLCSNQPTDRANALALALASASMSASDFTISNGDISGRKLAVAAKNNVPVTATGTGNHIALIDDARLLYVTVCTPRSVTAGDQLNMPSWDIELADPV